jgi:hypothetical protein
MLTRLIHFAGSTIAIEYETERAGWVLDYLFRDLQDNSPDPPHMTYRLLADDASDLYSLYAEDAPVLRDQPEEEIAAYLLDRACFHLADRSQGGMLIHAAGLAWKGQGLLLPGPSGSGKSTLAAWLLGHGFEYLTDELVFIPNGCRHFEGLARPLNLKRTARQVLKEMLAYQDKPAEIMSSQMREITPPSVLNPGSILRSAPLGLIVLPHYQEGAAFELRLLSKARAGLALMEGLINARNLEEHGFPEVARLARLIPAYQLTYGAFEQIEGKIEDLFETLARRKDP